MALSRTIPIRGRVFNTETLAGILEELSAQYPPPAEKFSPNTYVLAIAQDEHTTTYIDTPPKAFEALLDTQIRYLSLDIRSYGPRRTVELTLYPGSDSVHNSIRISGDEDWVNLTFTKSVALLDKVEPQSDVLAKNVFWILPILTLLVGWLIDKLVMRLMLAAGAAELVPWTWELAGKHLVVSVAFGILPATWTHVQSLPVTAATAVLAARAAPAVLAAPAAVEDQG
ncbi:MAG: hypothetical protein ACXV9Q_01820 [Chthoniobacterales bacterium]